MMSAIAHLCSILRILIVEDNHNIQLKNFDNFLTFAQNIDRGHTLEPHQ